MLAIIEPGIEQGKLAFDKILSFFIALYKEFANFGQSVVLFFGYTFNDLLGDLGLPPLGDLPILPPDFFDLPLSAFVLSGAVVGMLALLYYLWVKGFFD